VVSITELGPPSTFSPVTADPHREGVAVMPHGDGVGVVAPSLPTPGLLTDPIQQSISTSTDGFLGSTRHGLDISVQGSNETPTDVERVCHFRASGHFAMERSAAQPISISHSIRRLWSDYQPIAMKLHRAGPTYLSRTGIPNGEIEVSRYTLTVTPLVVTETISMTTPPGSMSPFDTTQETRPPVNVVPNET
jgi:hypothetical protein